MYIYIYIYEQGKCEMKAICTFTHTYVRTYFLNNICVHNGVHHSPFYKKVNSFGVDWH